jgi:hypothetical protein
MDLCAWCHAGAGVSIAQAFTYVLGGALDKSLALPRPDANAHADVHGSQVELLEKSPLLPVVGNDLSDLPQCSHPQHDLAAFSQVCLNCHKPETAMFPS